jgi:hypothetical protein
LENNFRVLKEIDIKEVLALPNIKRYELFIQLIVSNKEVYGLYNDGWAVQGDGNSNFFFPVWPDEAFAKIMISDNWKQYHPKQITLTDFYNVHLAQFESKNVKLSIFPTLHHNTLLVKPDVLKRDIEIALVKLN